MDKCPFCGADEFMPSVNSKRKVFDCETEIEGEGLGRFEFRGRECFKIELAALKKLVLEINDTVDRFGIVVLRPQLREILNRPEVQAIMLEDDDG